MNLYAQPHCLSLAILLLIQILERYFWDPGFHYITLLTGNRDLPRSTNRMCIFFCVCLPGIYEIIVTINKVRIKIRMFIMHRRLENSLLTTQNSPANIQQPTTIFYSDVELPPKYSPVTLHLSPATRILHENPAKWLKVFFCHTEVSKAFLSSNSLKTCLNENISNNERANLHLTFIGFCRNQTFLCIVFQKKKGIQEAVKKGAGCWIFMKKKVAGMQDQNQPGTTLQSAIVLPSSPWWISNTSNFLMLQ